MDVSIIIINYNTFQLTSECIRSVIEFTKRISYEIILVDNASVECDAELFKEKFPGIILIKSQLNGGFAYGNNLGIDNASGDFILLLNSDTVLTTDSIADTVEFAKNNTNTGVVGCRMIFPDGSVQYTARRFRSIQWELLDLFRFIPMFIPYKKRAKLMLGKYFRHDENMACDWVNGAFFLFPKKILSQFPESKLDDRFFMYGEDHLWCAQIKKLGYNILFFAGTTIIHINSGSTKIERQLDLRNTMMKHELEIMKWRKGNGFYFIIFSLVYKSKEGARNFIKKLVYKSSGKMLR